MTQYAVMIGVSRFYDRDDRVFGQLAGLAHYGLVKVHVERLSDGVHALDADAIEQLHEIRLNELDAFVERLEVARAAAALDRALEVIDHRKDLAEQLLVGVLERL